MHRRVRLTTVKSWVWIVPCLLLACLMVIPLSSAQVQQPASTPLPPVHTAEPREVKPVAPVKPGPEPVQPPDSRRDFYRPFVEGLYVRKAYLSENTVPPVEVWNVVVAPGKAGTARFHGGVVFEVIDGSVVVVEPKRGEIRTGGTFTVGQGRDFTLHNDGDRPATLRAVIIGGEEF